MIFSPTVPTVVTTVPTVLSVSRHIAEKFAIPEEIVTGNLIEALLTHRLFVRDEGGFKYKPDFLDISVERINVNDLNRYMESENPSIHINQQGPEDNSACNPPIAIVHPGDHAECPGNYEPPEKVQDFRIKAIMSALVHEKIDPMCVPRGSKKVVNAHCLTHFKPFTDSTFNSAWKEASKRGQLRAENHDQYTKGRH